MLFFGFSAGLPLFLIFSSLSLWLREAGVERSVVTFFSWAALGYSFKFVWAPLVDTLKLPWLTCALGRRRSWILVAQFAVMLSIMMMALQDPSVGENSLVMMAIAAVLLGFSSATQDIVIDAYRIESAEVKLQALMSSTYIAGYRIGMLVGGAGALFLASYFGSTAQLYVHDAWKHAYFIMAACMLVGVVTTLLIPEPDSTISDSDDQNLLNKLQILILFLFAVMAFILSYWLSSRPANHLNEMLLNLSGNKIISSVLVEFLRLTLGAAMATVTGFVLVKLGWVKKVILETLYINPVKDFFKRYGLSTALLLLSLIGLYRISDIVLGVISNVFYYDLGFNKEEIATVSKTFGFFMTLIGGFLGGALALQYGVLRVLLLGAILSAATNLLFMVLANVGYDIVWLYVVIGADNLSGGIATASFVAFLSFLTNIKFTAMQYAIFSSLMTLLPKMLGGYSGSMVDAVGYSEFFIITALLGVPVIILILMISRNSRFGNL